MKNKNQDLADQCPNPADRYRLEGPQVEPESSFWFRCPQLRIVTMEEVTQRLDGQVPPFPDSQSPQAIDELQLLEELYTNRRRPFRSVLPKSRLSKFLIDPIFAIAPPAGAVLNKRPELLPIIKNGEELARLFEAETPGLWHRHVLNVMFDPRPGRREIFNDLGIRISPPRQAVIWAALDVAIASALMAAWHFKWLSENTISFRERPVEEQRKLPVLFDFEVEFDCAGNIVTGTEKLAPQPSPGTPRHPAYPSGHSTYSAAASEVLACFFPPLRREFELLAENIGEARLWGGVHWLTDHVTGQKIGKAVGELVIDQLNRSFITPNPNKQCPDSVPPTQGDLERIVAELGECGIRRFDYCTESDILNPDTTGYQNLQG